MSHEILEGKNGIIFGALDNSSIAWKTAEAVYKAGGRFVLTNAPVAIRMGSINKLAKQTNSNVIAADAASAARASGFTFSSCEFKEIMICTSAW